ncbi:enduracididine biosynthesis enzyme MppR [Streptosporangium sp. NPDC000396]|uniref:enduracididine biosynthesis enzyme MppR n=1 Tax=Streptosporangium sp. NPDC000396 TaxID=3366185 RepID=UPI003694C7F9
MTTVAHDTGPIGYSLPLSPSGNSSMITPPPWHFSGEVVMVDYRVDPAAALRFLPPGLELGPDPGAAAAVFAEWQWCSDSGAELEDPVRCRFSEFLILLACTYRGEPMARCPYAWVDQAVPLMRGWIQGMPKQHGSVHLTRPVRVGRAGPRLGPGGRFTGSVAVHDRRLAEAGVVVRERSEPPALHRVPLVHNRFFPGWDPAEPPMNQLVASEVTGVEFGEVWAGSGEVRFLSGVDIDPDLALLAPVEVGSGYVFSYAETLLGGRRLA